MISERKAEKMKIYRRVLRMNNLKNSLKFSLRLEWFVTKTKWLALTFKPTMLNRICLFWSLGPKIYWYNYKNKEKHNCTVPNGHRDILLKTWRLMSIILFLQRCQLKGSVCRSFFSCSLAATTWTLIRLPLTRKNTLCSCFWLVAYF